MVTIRQSVQDYMHATQDLLNLGDLSGEELRAVDEMFQKVLVMLKENGCRETG